MGSVRFLSFRRKCDGMRDAWFVLDTLLAAMMAIETWVMPAFFLASSSNTKGLGNSSVLTLLRLLRLLRLARMARLMRAVPELMVLLKGLGVASRSVLCTLALLLVIIYIFAIAFTQITEDTTLGDDRFESVLRSMSTLLLQATLPDLADIVEEAGREHWLYALALLIFILLASLTVMNMLIGVLVEVVGIVSAVENEQRTVNFVKQRMLTMLTASGVDEFEMSHHKISRHDFEKLLLNR